MIEDVNWCRLQCPTQLLVDLFGGLHGNSLSPRPHGFYLRSHPLDNRLYVLSFVLSREFAKFLPEILGKAEVCHVHVCEDGRAMDVLLAEICVVD